MSSSDDQERFRHLPPRVRPTETESPASRPQWAPETDETVSFGPAGRVRAFSDLADGLTSAHLSKTKRRFGTAVVFLILGLTIAALVVGWLSRG
jgi:hypothetical protein